jgi:hypothetical protein
VSCICIGRNYLASLRISSPYPTGDTTFYAQRASECTTPHKNKPASAQYNATPTINMSSSNSSPLSSFVAQLIMEMKPLTASHVSLITDNARLIRVDSDIAPRAPTTQAPTIKSARHHKPSRWNETKSSNSVPRAPPKRSIT